MAALAIRNIHKSFHGTEILKGIDLTIQDQEFVVFVGPSGCGKSTLLRLIAGLEEVSSGQLLLGNRDITYEKPAKRQLAMVFQSYALYPHMSVYDNMAFALKMEKLPSQHIKNKVYKAAEVLELSQLLDRKPKALSGGQRQRVAIGRAIVREPELFLFDEPLSNLDAALRVQMRMELARLHRELRATMIYVTHDQVEAMTLADKVVVLNHGQIEQVGSPLALYHHPVNQFVAGFLGMPKMNFLEATVESIQQGKTCLRVEQGYNVVLSAVYSPLKAGDIVTLGIRPEHIIVSHQEKTPVSGSVEIVELLGSDTFCTMRLKTGKLLTLRASGEFAPDIGATVHIQIDEERCHLFNQDGRVVLKNQV